MSLSSDFDSGSGWAELMSTPKPSWARELGSRGGREKGVSNPNPFFAAPDNGKPKHWERKP